MNKEIEKLKKIQDRARTLADLRDINERKFDRAYEAARKSPGWAAYCAETGTASDYNYGDVIC